jgi:hemin uptake protein HemP
MDASRGQCPGASQAEPAPRGIADASTQVRRDAPIYISSDALFGNARELVIQHGDESYRLRKTRLGKLLLTK